MTDEEYDAKQKEIFAEFNIPQELKGALSYMAYERGHSAGVEEQAIILRNLASDLSQPLQDLIARIKRDGPPKTEIVAKGAPAHETTSPAYDALLCEEQKALETDEKLYLECMNGKLLKDRKTKMEIHDGLILFQVYKYKHIKNNQ
jgi:hypothetical protein